MDRIRSFLGLGLLLTSLQTAAGAPILRLTVPLTLQQGNGNVQPIWIAEGSNGPADLFFEAWNDGDGSLSLAVNGGAAAWLKPELGASDSCSFDFSRTCRRILVRFEAASLGPGTFQGEVEVRDPAAVDSPQRVPITIHVGGNVPDRIDLYVPPVENATDAFEFQTPGGPPPEIASNGFVNVVTIGLNPISPGTRLLHVNRVSATYSPGLPAGDSDFEVTVSSSQFGPDNRTIPGTVHITSSPIVEHSPASLRLQTAQGLDSVHGGVQQAVVFSNRGQGTLTISGVDVETDSGGDWLSTEDLGDGTYLARAAAGDLEPGRYQGRLRFNSDAANSPTEVSVVFDVVPPGPPETNFRGVVNGASFEANVPLAPGAIVSLFGTQLALTTETSATIPLPREMAATKVLVNGVEAPLYFVSYGQINFQIPNEAPAGLTTVQVMREDLAGNLVSAGIVNRTPGIFLWPGLGLYGIIENFSQGNNCPLPPEIPCPTGATSAPARPGDVLVIWCQGLGPTNPAVPTGEATPSGPLSETSPRPRVIFGRSIFGRQVVPNFAGLSPESVGLFQVNVAVPSGLPANPRTGVAFEFPDASYSNWVEIAVEP